MGIEKLIELLKECELLGFNIADHTASFKATGMGCSNEISVSARLNRDATMELKVENLSDEDFRYLIQIIAGLKKKG